MHRGAAPACHPAGRSLSWPAAPKQGRPRAATTLGGSHWRWPSTRASSLAFQEQKMNLLVLESMGFRVGQALGER